MRLIDADKVVEQLKALKMRYFLLRIQAMPIKIVLTKILQIQLIKL